MSARLLQVDELEKYAALRRSMLIDSPWSFASSPEDDVGSSVESILKWFQEDYSEVVVVDHPVISGALATSVGIRRERKEKFRHRAGIWGVFTAPDARGQGFAGMAMERAIDIARGWDGVEVLQLSVSANSEPARGLYESLGFRVWGTEPDCLRVDGVSFDEHHMWMRLG